MTNMVGNGVATVVMAKWENEFDADRARRVLDSRDHEPAKPPSAHMPETPAEAVEDLKKA